MDLNDHHIVSVKLSPVEHSPESPACPEYFVRCLSWIRHSGERSELRLFASSAECLALLGEKPAEARLGAYADQARSCLPDTDGAVDLIAEARDYPTMFGDPPGGPPEAAPDNAADALRPKPLY